MWFITPFLVIAVVHGNPEGLLCNYRVHVVYIISIITISDQYHFEKWPITGAF